jgi:hypothetical protein
MIKSLDPFQHDDDIHFLGVEDPQTPELLGSIHIRRVY